MNAFSIGNLGSMGSAGGALPVHMNGVVDDAKLAVSLAEQRVKGILVGVAVGAIGTAILAYLYGGPVLAALGFSKKSG